MEFELGTPTFGEITQDPLTGAVRSPRQYDLEDHDTGRFGTIPPDALMPHVPPGSGRSA